MDGLILLLNELKTNKTFVKHKTKIGKMFAILFILFLISCAIFYYRIYSNKFSNIFDYLNFLFILSFPIWYIWLSEKKDLIFLTVEEITQLQHRKEMDEEIIDYIVENSEDDEINIYELIHLIEDKIQEKENEDYKKQIKEKLNEVV